MPRTILITGANRGLGLALVQALDKRAPEDHVLLAVRDVKKGEAAVAELRKRGVKSKLDVVRLDLASNESIIAAEKEVREKYEKLDVLVNNAGIGKWEKTYDDLREAYRQVFDINVAAVVVTCAVFIPLLKETSSDPRIIQVSSARASMQGILNKAYAPSPITSYPASKAALNNATFTIAGRPEYAGVAVQIANPGHCKTDLNNNTGPKDPLDGVKVVVELILEEKGRECAMWEMEGEQTVPTKVAW